MTAGLPGSPVANETAEVLAALFLMIELAFLRRDSAE